MLELEIIDSFKESSIGCTKIVTCITKILLKERFYKLH